ncbi:helix-turn-helix domain-containing protein [Roseivirga ehrenbergii]|uniref:helix-turn-helix domain-containing protein n=1 Tax=Roseivirga ehrenbergii (strain DSM 102268 / JCM 13514 / KCTC 12282 / NCIMB 14502 / KMM 6017) TaxID=279360 RepID=UPI0012FE1F9E|nr:AraC family transcriptional regulator [Roseivirga ehrenbergii]
MHISRNRFESNPLNYPFKRDSFSLILITSGTLKIQLNLITLTLNRNEIIIVRPQVVAHILEISSELSVVSVSFTVDFIIQNAFKKEDFDAFDFFSSSNIPKLKLSNEETDSTISIAKILERNNRFTIEVNPFKEELINSSFRLLLYHFASIFKKVYPNLEADLSRQEDLALRFLNLLNENLKNERTVKFYADVLCITSGYLSKVLKEVFGKTANQLIDEAVILEAKLLLSSPSLSISEIAYELRFSDQSSFGKFFKKHVGFSPKAFRKGAQR